jgi:hypothetical protein
VTTTRTRTAPRSATLLGIDAPEGAHCQDCDRELTARLFRVRVTATGEVRYLGRKCAARATGYPTTRIEHEARRAEQMRESNRAAALGTVEQLADTYRQNVVTYPGDLMEVWAPEGGYRVLPVIEAARICHADLVERLHAGEFDA